MRLREYNFLFLLLVLVTACSQGESLSKQYRNLGQIDGTQEIMLRDELLVELTFGHSVSQMTIADFLPDYVTRYALSDEEILVVGRWRAADSTGPGSYYFLPNRLALYATGGLAESGERATLSVGEWRIVNGDIIITTHGYLIRDANWTTQNQTQHFTRIEPKDFVVGRVSYISEYGYTARPFLRIDYRGYLDRRFEPRDEYTFEPTVFVRSQHSEDILNNHVVRYDYLNVVFSMEERDITVEEFLGSNELIEAMISRQEWVIDRRLEALGL